jgi:hypothetical protein
MVHPVGDEGHEDGVGAIGGDTGNMSVGIGPARAVPARFVIG